MLDSNGRFINPAFATGHTGVVDGGYRTIDSAIFEGPTLLENSAQSLTNSITGVYQLMQRWAMDEFGEDWTEEECETNLRKGYAILRESKVQADLSDWIDDLGARLADLIEADVFQKQWNGLGDVDRASWLAVSLYGRAPSERAFPQRHHSARRASTHRQRPVRADERHRAYSPAASRTRGSITARRILTKPPVVGGC